jgi:hypothetical protein
MISDGLSSRFCAFGLRPVYLLKLFLNDLEHLGRVFVWKSPGAIENPGTGWGIGRYECDVDGRPVWNALERLERPQDAVRIDCPETTGHGDLLTRAW